MLQRPRIPFRRAAALILGLVLFLFCSSCSPISDPVTLLRPPKPTGEYSGIATALQQYAKEDVLLQYPKTGTNLSAYILHDFNGDGTDEALAFYKHKKEGSPICIALFGQKNGAWTELDNVEADGSDIESVSFENLTGNPNTDFVVGWDMLTTNDKQAVVYSVIKNRINVVTKQSYAAFTTCDLFGTGVQDLVLARLDPANKAASATVVSLNNGDVHAYDPIPMDGNVTRYLNAVTGIISGTQQGVYFDASIGDIAYITELIMVNQGSAEDVFYDTTKQANVLTKRSTNTLSQDINNDGKIEMPLDIPLPGVDLTSGLTLTLWRQYDGSNFVNVMSALMDYSDSFYFVFPPRWLDANSGAPEVTVAAGEANEQKRDFFSWDTDTKATGMKLLTIQLFTTDEWNQLNQTNWTEITQEDDIVFAGQIYGGSALSLSKSELLSYFHLLNP